MKKEGSLSSESKAIRFSLRKASDIATMAQLLSAIKDDIGKMREAQKKKDAEQLAGAKREILSFQKKMDELL